MKKIILYLIFKIPRGIFNCQTPRQATISQRVCATVFLWAHRNEYCMYTHFIKVRMMHQYVHNNIWKLPEENGSFQNSSLPDNKMTEKGIIGLVAHDTGSVGAHGQMASAHTPDVCWSSIVAVYNVCMLDGWKVEQAGFHASNLFFFAALRQSALPTTCFLLLNTTPPPHTITTVTVCGKYDWHAGQAIRREWMNCESDSCSVRLK